MNYQKKFTSGVIDRLKNLISKGDLSVIKCYLNKNEFKYNFENNDFTVSEFEAIPFDLGDKMINTFNSNLNQKSNDYRKSDFECAKLLYENIRISPRQASDIDFWNYLHHFDMYKYIHLRWNEIENPSKSSQETYLNRHWLMTLSSQKHLINFPLTTLWWSIHLTIDEDLDDPYELSRIYFNNNRYRTVTFGGSSYVRHKEAILGILQFYKKYNIRETKEYGDKISKFVNLLGGTKPLGFFNRDWFVNQLEMKFQDLCNPEELPFSFIETVIEKKQITGIPEKVILKDKIIKYFNLTENGTHKLTDMPTDFSWSIPINQSFSNGYLLMCYNEEGNINKVTLSSLLNKSRDIYKNGVYKINSINNLLIDNDENQLIGICYSLNGNKFFKAHLIKQLKENNDVVGLKGYQTVYDIYDKIEYKILPFECKDKLGPLLIKSFPAKGKPLKNKYYKEQWGVLNKYWPEIFK
jgi:hypothetical protein